MARTLVLCQHPDLTMVVPTSTLPRRRTSLLSVLGGKNILALATILGLSFLGYIGWTKLEQSQYDQLQLRKKPLVTILDDKLFESGTESKSSQCLAAVDKLMQLRIRLIALDFDLTIVDIHTGGQWGSTPHDLASHVRPHLKCLIETAIREGLHVAVASFSAQEDLIRHVISETIPTSRDMIVRGGRNRSEPEGKRKQLAEALYSIGQRSGATDLSPSNTILIDDDKNNVRMAKSDGYYSLWFDPDNVDGFFTSITSMEKT